MLHSPESRAVDIVFVHGLAGHSHRTWTRNREPSLFWPKSWLPIEAELINSRILTFGYNASWRGSENSSHIGDFAKDLLYQLRFGRDSEGNTLSIGSSPIIFVAHSMGGLVIKKAYLKGLHDETYQDISASTSAMVFLSTPHRGTNLAEALKAIMAMTLRAPKPFISDLNQKSYLLEELNDQFRHVASNLTIWSFYETIASTVGPKKQMILEKYSSVLGYPDEVSIPLNADHHNVCKFSSVEDPNYIAVKNCLVSLVSISSSRWQQKLEEAKRTAEMKDSVEIKAIFRHCVTSEDDYSSLKRRRMPGTCFWFLERSEVQTWLDPTQKPHVLWCDAPPGSGKSVLAAYVANHMQEIGKQCQYFFFSHADQRKSSAASALKALALQMATSIPELGKRITRSRATVDIASDNPHVVWRNLFEGSLAGASSIGDSIYWVIDALDECTAPAEFLDCLIELPKLNLPIKVLILSRNTTLINRAFGRLSRSTEASRMKTNEQPQNQSDIAEFLEQEIEHVAGSPDFRKALKNDLLHRSKGNFLWTTLVVDDILTCHTEQDIRKVLDGTPNDMLKLYARMEKSLVDSNRQSSITLLRAIFEWVTCSQRNLDLLELSQALQPEFPGLLSLSKTINDTCGHFVQVDGDGKVAMLHQTAREYLVGASTSYLSINESETHKKLFHKTLSSLESSSLKLELLTDGLSMLTTNPFIFYSAVSWPYHFRVSDSKLDASAIDRLTAFFRGPAVLCWIHALSLIRQVDVLLSASKLLLSSSLQLDQLDQDKRASRTEDVAFHKGWAEDLRMIVGRFGDKLVAFPNIIHHVLPVLCPSKTSISNQIKNNESSNLRVLGMQNSTWSDHLTRLTVAPDGEPRRLKCGGRFLAVLASTNIIHFWDSSTFEKAGRMKCSGYLSEMAFNKSGTKFVTFGSESTNVWAVPSGQLLFSVPNPQLAMAMDMYFADDDETVVVGFDDKTIRHFTCRESTKGWQFMFDSRLEEMPMDKALALTPSRLAFNGDKTMVGMSYKSAPLSVWTMSDGRCINRCKRWKDPAVGESKPQTTWCGVGGFCWNPVTSHIIGLYNNSSVFKWHPMTEEHVEVQEFAVEVTASPNGELFASARSDGSIFVWSFKQFRMIHKIVLDDLIMQLQFSPDSRRIYDIGLDGLNVWEPQSAVGFCEDETPFLDANTEPAVLDVSSQYPEQGVTALSKSPNGPFYCAGYENGQLLLFSGDNEKEWIELPCFKNVRAVEHIAWSHDGNCVAAADLFGEVQMIPITCRSMGQPKGVSTAESFVNLTKSSISDLLFNMDDSVLLIIDESNCLKLSTSTHSVTEASALEVEFNRKWICHPNNPELVIDCGLADIRIYNIASMELQNTVSLQLPIDSSLDFNVMNRAIPCQDPEYFILQRLTGILRSGKYINSIAIQRHLEYSISSVILPTEVSRDVHRALNILPGGKFVFLNHDLWLCAYTLGFAVDPMEPYQRFYFIPRDWAGAESAYICDFDSNGTLYWPKHNHIVRIQCDLDFARSIPPAQRPNGE